MLNRRLFISVIIVLTVGLLLAACGQEPTPDATAVAQLTQTAVAATLTAQPTPTPIPTNTPVPPTDTPTTTPTATNTPTLTPTNTPKATSTPTDTPAPTATSTPAVVIVKTANLRAGPGTNYQIVGKVSPGDDIEVTGKDKSGKWYQVKTTKHNEAWIAGFLLKNVNAEKLSVKTSSAPTVTPAPPAATPKPSASQNSGGSGFAQIGDEIEGGGWRFKVVEVHKRKVVYFYDSSYVAMGNFLIVVVEAVNLQSGTDYFAHNIRPYVVDKAGNAYDDSVKGSIYAQWQLGGLDSFYTDVNPGQTIRMATAYDIPDGVGDVLLSTAILEWVYLGNFNQMPVEK